MSRTLRSALLAVLLFPTITFGWSTKEHIQLTRIAAARLLADPQTPPAMKEWLKQAAPAPLDMEQEKAWFINGREGVVPHGVDGVAFWATMPDMVTLMDSRPEPKVEPFGVPERLLHYIDLELFVTGDQKREYRHDLSGKPKLTDIPRDMKDPRYVQAGMLPFRVEACYKTLIEQIKAGRLVDKPGQYPRDEHATKWAGYLAHYLEDNTQPQHATIDYKSSAYFAEKRKAPNVHAQVEYMMADDDKNDHQALREEYWPLLVKAIDEVSDPTETNDLWQATLEISLASYDALPMIGTAAMAATKQAGTPDHPTGAADPNFDTEVFYHSKGDYHGKTMTVLEMKAYQQAWAVKRVQRVWRAAWDAAQAAK